MSGFSDTSSNRLPRSASLNTPISHTANSSPNLKKNMNDLSSNKNWSTNTSINNTKHFSIQFPSNQSQSSQYSNSLYNTNTNTYNQRGIKSNNSPSTTNSSVYNSKNSSTNLKSDTKKLNILNKLKQLALFNKGTIIIDDVPWSYYYNERKSLIKNNNSNNTSYWKSATIEINNDGNICTGNSLIIFEDIRNCKVELINNGLILKVSNELNTKKVFFKFTTLDDLLNFLSTLMVWSNLNSCSIFSKWDYHKSMIFDSNLKPNDIIICRFKVFGPIKHNLKFTSNPINPIYPTPLDSEIKEGWFTVIGHLLPTGVLNLVSDIDGSLIYSINITMLYESEVRILHESILQTSNVLYLGKINDLRLNHGVSDNMKREKFIIGIEDAPIERILIDFDLSIDLEDWYVALLSFTKLEYVSIKSTKINDESINLKINKFIKLEIMEAQFNIPKFKDDYLYCELNLWNTSWFRTAIVCTDFRLSTFWKELINFKLPIFSNYNSNIKILIKKSQDNENYNFNNKDDEIIGICNIEIDNENNNHFLSKFSIINLQNNKIGELMINLEINETNVLSSKYYKNFEKYLMNVKINEVLNYFEFKINTNNLENYSIMLLDIYQSLDKENEFLETLMKRELVHSEKNIYKFNTIFRGNSMLSKSLEKYTLRVGHEYLEKLLGPFITLIQKEDLNCECDPRIESVHFEENYLNLLKYIKLLWNRIYNTTNDIPLEIKTQWKNLRINVEMSTIDLVNESNNLKIFQTDDNKNSQNDEINNNNDKLNFENSDISLNALSSFIFLRFLCPAILSPKLYNISKIHYSGKISRTLVLIAKTLMIFANRSNFSKHKDPYLLKLNDDFLNKHRDEMIIYFDKVTLRKMDFNEKLLDMSNIFDRIKLNTSEEILNELPTMPFLIDKYGKISQFINILGENEIERNNNDKNKDYNNNSNSNKLDEFNNEEYQLEEFDNSLIDDNDFLVSMSNEIEFADIIDKNYSMKDLINESKKIVKKSDKLLKLLEIGENPKMINNWNEFIDNIIRSCRIKENRIIYDGDVFRDKRIRLTKDNERKFDSFFESIKIFENENGKEYEGKIGINNNNKTAINKNNIDSIKKVNNQMQSMSSFKNSNKVSKTEGKETKVEGKTKRGIFGLFRRKSSIQ